MGRPTKHSPELQERICQLIRVGNSVEVAAEAAGIAPVTVYSWKQTNAEFADAIETARAEAETLLVARISKVAQRGSWRAACWLLERHWPEEWAVPKQGGDPDLARELERLQNKPRRAAENR